MDEALNDLASEIAGISGINSIVIEQWLAEKLPEPPEQHKEAAHKALEQAEAFIDWKGKQLSGEAETQFVGKTVPQGAEMIEGLAEGKLIGAVTLFKNRVVLLVAAPRTRIVGACYLLKYRPSRDQAEKIARDITNSTIWPMWAKIGAVI